MIDISNQSNSQILKNVNNKYNSATITYTSSKDNWIVVSGYFSNGYVFYDKTIVATILSQYNEIVKIVVSSVVTNSKEDAKGSDLAKIIHSNLKVYLSGNTNPSRTPQANA